MVSSEAIYKGATRPAMKFGIPLVPLVALFGGFMAPPQPEREAPAGERVKEALKNQPLPPDLDPPGQIRLSTA